MSADIFVDFGRISGKIKPLHGVNNGPVCYGSMVDVTKYYQELGVPWVRIHDPNWPHPREVDYYTIFPDFSRDADDPANYDFRRTDDYIRSIVETGARIVYRLGVSIEHTKRKYHVHPPADFDKWADVCIHIIRHYNEGWAEGFQYGIRHWEIWNEPEGGGPGTPQDRNAMWSGTSEQYFDLYRAVSTRIKAACPDVNVGGFAYTYVNPEFLNAFLRYVKDHALPLDFFSWHTYASNPLVMVDHTREIKKTLDEYGFTGTEIHCNEYNYALPLPQGTELFGPNGQKGAELFFEALKNENGASFCAAVLTALQDGPVEVMNYYDAAPSSFWSFFNQYGVPQKAYFAFKAFKYLVDLGNRAAAGVDEGSAGLYCLGAVDSSGAQGAVLLANFDAREKEYEAAVSMPSGRTKAEAEIIVIDDKRTYETDRRLSLDGTPSIFMRLKPRSVLLMKLAFR